MPQDRGVIEADDTTGLPTSSSGGSRQYETEGDLDADDQRKLPASIGLGPLLEKTKKDAAKLLNRMWDAQDPTWKSARERWKANKWRMEGILGVQLVRVRDSDDIKAYAPPGGASIPPMMNRMARNARRLIAQLYADPPVPEGVPSGGPDHNPEKAEFAARVLQEVGGEAGVDDVESAKEAERTGSIYGSGFRRYWVDPKGGGHRPRQIMAHPAAQTEDQYDTDPATGSPAVTFVERFVAADGQLVDDPDKAELEWLPKLRCEVGDSRQVRPVPETARHMGECDGLMWRCFVPFAELRAIAPEWAEKLEADPERARKILGHDPNRKRDFLPDHIKETTKDITPLEGESRDSEATVEIPDDHLVLATYYWNVITATYPKGCYVLMAGESEIVYRGEWQMEDGKKRDIPVDQFKQFSSWSRDFYGFGLCDLLGNMGELVAQILSMMLEHLDRFSNRKTFVPMNSTLSPKMLESMTGTVVPFTGEKPVFEDIPELPAQMTELLDRFLMEHDEEAGIGGPGAQGGSDPNIQSGLHQQQVMEAVAIGLSDVKQNAERGHKRGWRIQAQEVKEGFTTEQELSWVGEDGQFKQRAFHGADLTGTKEFAISKGSFTGLTPSAKMAIAEHASSLGLLSGPALKRAWMGNTGGLIGAQDDPHYQRVKNQIADWEEGPPEGMAPPPAPVQSQPASIDPMASTQAPAASSPSPVPAAPSSPTDEPELGGALDAGATGEGTPEEESAPGAGAPIAPPAPQGPPMPGAVDPIAAMAQQIFDQRPNDEEPEVALMRCHELSYAISGSKYKKFKSSAPFWCQIIDAEYQRMWLASGQQTVREQQAAAAAQAQADAANAQTEAQNAVTTQQNEATATQAAQPPAPAPAPGAGGDPMAQGAGVAPSLADPTAGGTGALEEMKALAKMQSDTIKAMSGVTAKLGQPAPQGAINIYLPNGSKKVIRDEAGVITGTEPA